MKQSKEIYEGFVNLLRSKVKLSDKKIEKMQQLRINICMDCPKRNTVMNTCRVCGCFLPAKTRSKTSSCPEGHWASII